jgi:3-oxoacyl-[acyl-carrier-protein] synthase II
MLQNNRRVVITGMGAVTPIGNTVQDYWSALLEGKSGAAPITHFDASQFDTKFACEVKNFDPLEYIDRKTARRLDPYCRYALAAAAQAVKDAGIDSEKMSQDEKDRTGVVFGSGMGGMNIYHEQTGVYIKDGPHRVSPFFVPMIIPDIAAGYISITYGFRGPNYCVVSACATGNNNIGDAFLLIRNGYVDAMLTGGSETGVTEMGLAGFNAMKALSTRNDSPETASRPFDATRDGFVLGEGSGALFIEELEHAKKRDAKIYAEIAGIGFSADAHHITAPEPEGKGAVLAMKMLMRDANLKPEDVDYLNMHGTSTPLGDVGETKAIKTVFGDHAYKMNLSSTKSMTGHMLGAAGAAEAIATILAIKHDTVPPTINFEHPDPACDLNYTFNKAEKRTVHVGISNAFGFGGHNTTVAFRKYEG